MKKGRPISKTAIQDYERDNNKCLPKLPIRCIRVMRALVEDHSKSREQIDRIAPSSNGPAIISQIRHSLKLDINCELVCFVTKDGDHSRYGVYQTTPEERKKMRKLLRAWGVQV